METTGTRRTATRTVCTLLNQRGGQVLFGVMHDGFVVEQQFSERTLEAVGAEPQRIEPPAFPTVEQVQVADDREVLVFGVSAGPRGRTPFGSPRIAESGIILWPCRSRSTTGCWSSVFTMNSVGRTSPLPGGRWMTWMRERYVAWGRKWCGAAGLEEPLSRKPADLLRGLGLLRDGVLFRAAAVLFGNMERLEFEMPQCLLRVARFRDLDKMGEATGPRKKAACLPAPSVCTGTSRMRRGLLPRVLPLYSLRRKPNHSSPFFRTPPRTPTNSAGCGRLFTGPFSVSAVMNG